MDLISQMRAEIADAEQRKKKMAMFLYQILINANQLQEIGADELCKQMGVRESYKVDVVKMLNVAKLMKERGVKFL